MLSSKHGVIAPGETLNEMSERLATGGWAERCGAGRWLRIAGRLNGKGRLRGEGWFSGEDSGQAALEFALVAPVMLLIVTGICTFGVALSNYMSLTEATDTGARQFAISRGATGDPCAIAISTIEAAAPSLTQSNLTFSFQVYTSSAATSSTTYTTSCSGVTLTQSAPVTVLVTYPCNLGWYNVTSAMATGGAACFLKAKTTEVLQ